MFNGTNILIFLLAIIPGLIYSIVIFSNSPRNQNVRLRIALQYLMYGMLSIFFVSAVHFIFPHWMEYLWMETVPITKYITPTKFTITFQEVPTMLARVVFWFGQVGMTEEVCKALTLLLITGLRLKSLRIKDKPYAMMFYAMMVSMGFALVENVMYGFRFIDHNPQMIMLIRGITAVVAHMIFGLMMGYFFSLGFKEIRGYNSEPTNFNIWARTHTKLRRTIFFGLGILVPTLFHGTYDFILDLDVNWITVAEFLIIGLGITYSMSKNLINKH